MRSLNLTKILSFHIDYLEIYGTSRNIKSIQKWLDFDNSNISSFGDFICMYSDARNYKSKVTFIKDNVPCFAYYEWIQVSELITTKNYFIVYGKAFRVFSIEEILAFIEEHLDMGLIKRLRSCSRCLWRYQIQSTNLVEPSSKNETENLREKAEHSNTYTIWKKQNREEPHPFLFVFMIRLQTYKQNDYKRLYPEYLQEDWVTPYGTWIFVLIYVEVLSLKP